MTCQSDAISRPVAAIGLTNIRLILTVGIFVGLGADPALLAVLSVTALVCPRLPLGSLADIPECIHTVLIELQ